MRRLFVLAALLVALPAGAVTMDWVYVGDPGNAPDTAANCWPYPDGSPDCGSVGYGYYISRYEVTNAQYAEFLNAKATSDPLSLYNTRMGSDATFGGITRSGNPGSYTYTVKAGFANKPVVYIDFHDAVRFTNWLNNGQGSGDTETGAYTLLGGTPIPSNGPTVTRNPTAITFLPTENEWYKAAYYNFDGTYFDYPTGTDATTGCVAPSADTGNSANCKPYAYPPGSLTDVGAYGLSDSPSGTFDQGGNVMEWNERNTSDQYDEYRGIRGGSWEQDASPLSASFPVLDTTALAANRTIGFRVASLVPNAACGDGLDNDGDGWADLDDLGCANSFDVDENSPTLPCDDGADNDGDGWTDYAGGDPGCRTPWSLGENPQCQDGVDNDAQPGIDFDGGASRNGGVPLSTPDPQCTASWVNSESRPTSCGLGFELVFLAPLLARLTRRRRG